MPRQQTTQVRMNLHQDQLAIGRMVKTVTYSRKLQQTFANVLPTFAPKDIQGWCNLNFTVQGIDRSKGIVALRYDIPNSRGQSCITNWPIAGLSKGFGIRI